MRRPRLAAVVGMIAVAGCAPPARAPVPSRIALAPCEVEGWRGPARCGTVRVPEDRAAPGGRQIGLRVVVVPAEARRAEPDAVFFLAGGPGQAATGQVAWVAGELAQVRRTRDLVFVDQRGMGGSNPLHCRFQPASRSVRAWLTGDFPAEDLAACIRAWDADPRFYTTGEAVLDLDRVREALGYPRVNLYGASYGTRPALAYLGRFPERVRTVLLRGVAPPWAALPLSVARDAQAALDAVIAGCRADAACAREYPSVGEDVAAALERAERSPARIEVAPGDTLVATREVLAGALVFALYNRQVAASIPAAARAAAEGDPGPWIRLATGSVFPAIAGISLGAYLSAVCTEDHPQIRSGAAEAAAAGTFLGPAMARGFARTCAAWPRGVPAAGYLDPVRADVPVLVVSGAVDPVTPPRQAEEVLRHLPRGAHLVLPATGHLGGSPCARGVMNRFIEQGSTEGLDLSCSGADRAAGFASPDTPGAQAGADTAGPPADVAGRWDIFWKTANGLTESGWLELRQDGGRVEATLHGRGQAGAAGTVRGRALVLEGRLMAPFEIRAAVQADSMDGVLRMLTVRREFIARRQR